MRCIISLLLLALTFTCTCHAYQFSLISSTLPKGSYYVVTSATSQYLSSYTATSLRANTSISTATVATDIVVNALANGYFAIVSIQRNSMGSFCVIRVGGILSSTLQQNGLKCTIAPSSTTARIQVEPSSIVCGGAGNSACNSNTVGKLDIDSINEQDAAAATATSSSNDPSLELIIALASGGILIIFMIGGIFAYRKARKRTAPKQTSSVIFNNPSITLAPIDSSPPAGVHVRTQTEQLMSQYTVNPSLDADQADIVRPTPYQNQYQHQQQHQAGNIYKPRLNMGTGRAY